MQSFIAIGPRVKKLRAKHILHRVLAIRKAISNHSAAVLDRTKLHRLLRLQNNACYCTGGVAER